MKTWICAILFVTTTVSALNAVENSGLWLDIRKIITEKNDHRGMGSRTEVDRTMALKVDIQNNSIKPLSGATLNYIILVKRWSGMLETGRVERIVGQVKLDNLPPSRNTTLNAGDVHIGGHLHSGADYHADHLVAWKVTINWDGKDLEFLSAPSFNSLNAEVGKDK